MSEPIPPLNALRAFEAAARHLSLSKAAQELHVTASALSHQIRGLEEMLGTKLFRRGVRSITLTAEGQVLLPGLQAGFDNIRGAIAALRDRGRSRVLVISTPPGFTAKWLAPRLYRFSAEHPDIDVRVSSSKEFVNLKTDGVDVAVRTTAIGGPTDPDIAVEKLVDVALLPVCSPNLLKSRGGRATPDDLKRLPLIHDDGFPAIPGWAGWLEAAGVDGVDVSRGLRFNSADHALDAVIEGAGVLLAYDILAYDDLRTGRLISPFAQRLYPGFAYHVACARSRSRHPNVQAFTNWLESEIAAIDWAACPGQPSTGKPRRRSPAKPARK